MSLHLNVHKIAYMSALAQYKGMYCALLLYLMHTSIYETTTIPIQNALMRCLCTMFCLFAFTVWLCVLSHVLLQDTYSIQDGCSCIMYLYRPSTLRHMLRIQRCAVHITSFMQTAVDYIYRATSSLRSNNTYTVSSTKFLCLQFGTWNNSRDPVCNWINKLILRSAYRVHSHNILLHRRLLILLFISAVLLHGLSTSEEDGSTRHSYSPSIYRLSHLHTLKVVSSPIILEK